MAAQCLMQEGPYQQSGITRLLLCGVSSAVTLPKPIDRASLDDNYCSGNLQNAVAYSLGLAGVVVVTDWVSAATSWKLVPKMLAVLPRVRADWDLDELKLSPLRKVTVLATLTTLTEPAEMLLMLT
ncbi:TPA: hypothetical protein ACH3X1_006141 [Trebouxia sp. C0004]